jgi:ribosomal protein S18 acetylase RimI-like enzyme
VTEGRPASQDTTLAIRRAVPGDGAGLAAVQRSAWRAAYRGLIPDALLYGRWAESRARAWGRALAHDRPPLVFVAVHGQLPLGFCAVATPSDDHDADGTVAKVMALNVRADCWRSGIGTALMGEALATFRSDGWRSASLWVLAGNDRGRAFYDRLGFEADGAADIFGESGAPVVRLRRWL